MLRSGLDERPACSGHEVVRSARRPGFRVGADARSAREAIVTEVAPPFNFDVGARCLAPLLMPWISPGPVCGLARWRRAPSWCGGRRGAFVAGARRGWCRSGASASLGVTFIQSTGAFVVD